MKKIFLVLILSALSQINYAQTTNSGKEAKERTPINKRNNELKLGVIKALVFPAIDIEYERIINSGFSFGSNVVYYSDDSDIDLNFSLSPFFRAYFTESEEYGTKGFFAQAILNYDNSSKQDYDAAGIGFGLGKKWVNNYGFILQLFIGGGRNIIEEDNAPGDFFKGDIFVGYRF